MAVVDDDRFAPLTITAANLAPPPFSGYACAETPSPQSVYQQALNAGLMSVDEARRAEGMAPLTSASDGLAPTWQGPATISTGAPNQVGSDLDSEALAAYLWPAIRDRLRAMAHPEAQAMAEAAAEVPGLDDLALCALADWLEEKQRPELAERMRRLAVEDGDVLTLECEQHLSPQVRKHLRDYVEEVFTNRGKNVTLLVLDGGMKLEVLRLAGRPKRQGGAGE